MVNVPDNIAIIYISKGVLRMKNPNRIRKLTNNICILEASLDNVPYSHIAKMYKISPSRVSQIICRCVERISTGINRPLHLKGIYKREDITKHKDAIIKMLFFYKNGYNITGIPESHVDLIHKYAKCLSIKVVK